MTARALIILITAVLLVGGAAAVVASTLGGDGSAAHTMPNGQTMPGGTMDDEQTPMSDDEGMPGSAMEK